MSPSFAMLVGLLVSDPAPAGHAFGLVVGSDLGLSDEPPLRFAEGDARALARTLIELGVVPREHLRVLLGATRGTVERSVREVSQEAGSEDLFFLFISAHGDERGVHVRGEILGWDRLRRILFASSARVVVAFVDACQSGALLTPKGFARAPPLKVSLAPEAPEGRVLITSSGANEISNESTRLQGSPFAHFLVSGLRGAADEDKDGVVTLVELYRYLHHRTIAATLAAPSGPQHPVQEVRLKGAGAVVLTRSLQGPAVVRSSGQAGTCFVLDTDEIRILAEIGPDDPGPLRLPPGEKVIKCVKDKRLAVARIHLGAGEGRPVDIDQLELRAEPVERQALAKGPKAERRSQVALATAVLTDPNAPLEPAILLRVRHGTRFFGWNVQVVAAETKEGRSARARLTAGLGYLLPWWTVGGTKLELGLELGAGLEPSGGADAPAFLLGQYAQVDWPSIDGLIMTSRIDLYTAYAEDRRGAFSVLLSLGVAHDWIHSSVP